jgi:hypothetical protein
MQRIITYGKKVGATLSMGSALCAVLLVATVPYAAATTVAAPPGTVAIYHQATPSPGTGLAGRVSPETASGCVGTNPWNNVQDCIYISGSGPYVAWMEGSAFIRNYEIVGHIQLYGPSGLGLNSSDVLMQPGNRYYILWEPNGDVVPGQYCSQTWSPNGSSGYYSWGAACETVS